MPLVTPVDVVPAAGVGPIHFIAIGGAGMSGIAAAYAALGVQVSGSDRDVSCFARYMATCRGRATARARRGECMSASRML